MPEQPPAQLVTMLDRLGLATATQVAKMGRRVGRLARDLPRFESVWVDALSQARILTPFQAAEINAGRGESLRLGPYVLCERLTHPYYVACYRARSIETHQSVRLAVVENTDVRASKILGQLESLTVSLPFPLSPLPSVDTDGSRIFVATPWVEGRTAADWIVHHGRLPPEVVLEIARAMLASLGELENAGICHGDVSISSLILTDTGGVMLSWPGLRGILRPEEGYAYADLVPEAYDSLAPERVATGTPPDVRSDVYACGCVWWHLLCGRPPLMGGSSVAKLRAVQAGEICDVRRYAPDVPPQLAAAISACLEREPGRRPESMARLAAMLGSPTRGGKEALADCLARAGRPTVHWTTTVRSMRKSNRAPLWLAGSVCCLAAIIAILWPTWHGRHTNGTIAIAASAETVRPRRSSVALEKSQLDRDQQPAIAVASTDETPVDTAIVVPTAYQQVEAKPKDLVLAASKPLDATSLDLRAGQCVRGPSDGRAAVLVPHAGLVVDKEDIRFENIDFVWRSTRPAENAKTAESAIVRLLASRAEFRGCSFRREATENGGVSAPPAIRWAHPTQSNQADISLPSGQLRMTDCLLHRVGAGIDCHTIGALAIEVRNTLHLEAGSFVRLDHCPQADEPTSISLAQVTLRDGGPLLECLVSRVEEQAGEITIVATACAFVPKQGMPLIGLTGAEIPDRLLAAIRWTGQGSLVAPRVPIVAWGMPDGQLQDMDESSLSIAGLVRSDVGFAGPVSNDPTASRLVRWQAPLQSADPPGIDPEPLHRNER
jgi:eukaryotic-like serine/threonine-protein kinase